MTTTRGEISSGKSGDLNNQLVGKVWLGQNKGEWPITLMVSESMVVAWMKQNPNGAVWEYSITPVRRVQVVNPEPYLAPAVVVEEAQSSDR